MGGGAGFLGHMFALGVTFRENSSFQSLLLNIPTSNGDDSTSPARPPTPHPLVSECSPGWPVTCDLPYLSLPRSWTVGTGHNA